MIEVRRDDDDELCGYVLGCDGEWQALTVFGGVLGEYRSRDEATDHVLNDGLSCLAERWEFRASPDEEWRIVCIQEASPDSVRLALDYYSMPGVPTALVTREELRTTATLRRQT